MKISEMTNDQACEAMIRLTGAFSTVCEDDEMMKLLDELNGKTITDAIKGVIPRFVAFALNKHKAELYEIVGALMMEPSGNVGKMNFMETVSVIRDSVDEVLTSFFPSSATLTTGTAAASV